MNSEDQNKQPSLFMKFVVKVDEFVSTSECFKPKWLIVDAAILVATLLPRLYSVYVH